MHGTGLDSLEEAKRQFQGSMGHLARMGGPWRSERAGEAMRIAPRLALAADDGCPHMDKGRAFSEAWREFRGSPGGRRPWEKVFGNSPRNA
jgi:hypothetical protein